MTSPVHILGIAGSLRKKSVNHGLLKAAAGLLPDGVTLEIFDLNLIPLFNNDLMDSPDYPEPVKLFKERISNADALLIATPEYNYSVPGVLKNALDWGSRPRVSSAFSEKPTAIMGAGGRSGTMRAQQHLRQIGVGMNLHILVRPEVQVQQAPQKFDSDGNLTDEGVRQEVGALVVALAAWTRKLRGDIAVEPGEVLVG